VSDLVPISKDALTPAQFSDLADVPPELEWLANITNSKTRRAFTCAHIIAWRKDMENRKLAPTSIRRKLSSLFSLFDYLCERNAVAGNPVDGVKRPMANNNEGSTPALGDGQARRLLEAPAPDTLKGVRDRAILATLLYHGIRREELCLLRLRDIQSRQGVVHLWIRGKRDKIRFVPVHPMALRLIGELSGDGEPRWGARRCGLRWPTLPPGEEQPHWKRWKTIWTPAPSTATSWQNTGATRVSISR
jgi:site-specific recombinase XerD